MKHTVAQFYCNINKFVDGSESFNMSIDHDGNLILLTDTNDLYHFINNDIIHLNIPTIENIFFTSAQPIGENWLLVAARIDEEDNDVKNAYVFATEGNILNRYEFGDAVEDVQTTPEGDVWVSYFDQSDAGRLNCYKAGDKTFDFYYSIRENNQHVPPIDDCYAMNVTSDSTNIYYYSDFPFLKIMGENEFELYEDIPIVGSKAFAVIGDDVLFSHGYDNKPEVYLYSLSEKKKVTFKTFKSDGSILNYDHSVGRESKLFLIEGTEVYVLDIKNVTTKLNTY
jgi:hypothetical protein